MEIISAKTDPWLVSCDAFAIYRQCMYKPTFEEYLNEVASFRADPAKHIFICRVSDRYAGIIVLETASDNTAEIVGIAVAEDCQRRGIGSFMVREAAQALNADFVTAETDSEAVGFYEHTRFVVKSFVRHFSDGDVTRCQCVLDIKQSVRH